MRPLALFALVAAAIAAEPQASDDAADSLDVDYGRQLPRIAPTQPEAALATFEVAEGFQIEQLAAEPLVTDPVAMAFDERGQLYVVEMRGYSEDDQQHLGRIRLLQDTDQDGRFDRSRIVIEGLSWPTAIACFDGGIFVGAAPDILYLKDTTGDGRADVRRTVFTGFGRGNVQGLLNSFEWGLDNRIHGATSSSGGEIHAPQDGTDAESLQLRGQDFAFDPRTAAIEATSGGAQHGLSFNRWGEKFVCHNSNHLQLVFTPSRYAARNPFQAMPSLRQSIAADGPQAEVFRSSPIEPWRIVRTRLRVKGLVPGPVEGGGRPAGYFTSATGITIYEGDAWPSEYRGWAIVADVGSNLIHRKRLDPVGASYVGHRVDVESEFVASKDIWFRPVQMCNGPDGALYVADMYREVIEHPLSLPPILKKHLDLTSGRDRGRIYRITPRGFRHRPAPDLAAAETSELVAALDHPNAWHRRTAARLLFERQDRSAVESLRTLARSGDLPEGRVAALWSLHGLAQLDAETLIAAVHDSHPRVRATGIRLGEAAAASSDSIRAALLARVDDADPRVRRQLAFTLGELSSPQAYAALARLAIRNFEDADLLTAVRTSLGGGVAGTVRTVLEDDSIARTPAGRQFVAELLRQFAKQRLPNDITQMARLVSDLADAESSLLPHVFFQLGIDADDPLYRQLLDASGGRAETAIARALDTAERTAVDPAASLPARIDAITTLRWSEFSDFAALSDELLQPNQPVEIQEAYVKALRNFKDPAAAALLIDTWRTLSPLLRSAVLDVLGSRDLFTLQWIDAMSTKAIPISEVPLVRLESLKSHPRNDIREAVQKLVGKGPGTADEAALLANYRDASADRGNAERGKAAFVKHCSSCHRLEDEGHALGPNLAAMNQRGAESILYNVLFPDKEVDPRYMNYVLSTLDGQTFNGMILAESPNSVTLVRGKNERRDFLRSEIDILQSTGNSLMPSSLHELIDVATMSDLLAYLEACASSP